MFNAWLLQQQADGTTHAELTALDESQLPAGDVLVQVRYSCMNYKDALAFTGRGKIVRRWPMVPGIDFAGTVLRSSDPRFAVDDEVMLTGWGVGEEHWGGLAELAQVKGDWLTMVPDVLTSRQVMAIGTAGLTAMLAVMALEEGGVQPSSPYPVAVTGASGGVGSVAISLLAALGYRVTAISGRADNAEYFAALGVSQVMPRAAFAAKSRLLDKQQWSGVIDCVGGPILASLISQLDHSGVAVACGLAASVDLPTSVMPFILRGVRLQGVDSVICPAAKRAIAWRRLAELLPDELYEDIAFEVPLDAVNHLAVPLLEGQITGRVLVNVSGQL